MLYRIAICNVIRRTVFTNTKIYYPLQVILNNNLKRYNLCTNYSSSRQSFNLITFKRFKSKNASPKHSKRDIDEEDEDENEINVDIDDLCTPKSKIIDTAIPSLRLDAVAKAGLGMSRAKLDKEFYKSNLRLNGQKCLKKSAMVKVGDEIDLVLRKSPENPKFIIVDRCVLASVSADVEEATIRAKIIQDKSLLIEDYDDPWSG
ncbi:mitochondrial transcription rescue factor 1 [Osmia bicornis bicornis]|uniref:mitochondrial transcription rescue factor 1 n=1 Tax=Osmia bicornis bicornis TaxID=1437191 RepID=UPI0010FA369E|nr:mitochondrial transcription rescue factor 1 [Osmia bicornis bicornis]